ncbi:MAG: hypothetical protein EKK41_03895 [Hyphomicrobiales bacterium]|nr:MAG: hypothetical protein EKK41_03895 [Hyphomicrobiales bacterium]
MPFRTAHPIVRYLAWQVLWAIAVPLGFCALFIAMDVAGLRTLVVSSPSPWVSTGVLLAGAVSTFAPLIFATGVALLAEGPQDPGY